MSPIQGVSSQPVAPAPKPQVAPVRPTTSEARESAQAERTEVAPEAGERTQPSSSSVGTRFSATA